MQQSSSGTSSGPQLWWESLPDDVECPITLEPINTLPYPPFVLHKRSTTNDDTDVSYYFDGHALASYIVSRGIFQNPLTRQPLTYEDCRSLDLSLEEYCYNNKDGSHNNNTITGTTKRLQVLEAFALRESVQVRTSGGRSEDDERQRQRAEFLRNEATAALSGLFVYGRTDNRHRSRNRNNADTDRQQQIRQHQHQQRALPSFGFDLNRSIPNHSTENDFGMVVIDDDEDVAVEREQEAYRELQEAFPRLSTQQQGFSDNIPQGRAHLMAINDKKLDQIRQNAERERFEEERKQQFLQLARRQLEQEAQQRREERKRERAAMKAKAEANHQKQRQEQDEIAQARAEIEQWREEHWERLRTIAEQQQIQQLEEERRTHIMLERERRREQLERERGEKETKAEEDEKEAARREAKQKAAKAAKRKRAKERKKQQQAQEQQEEEEKQKQAALEEKKKASNVKCAACQSGVLGVGFERFGHQFCSPKCARAGPSATTTAASKD